MKINKVQAIIVAVLMALTMALPELRETIGLSEQLASAISVVLLAVANAMKPAMAALKVGEPPLTGPDE